MPYSTAGHNFRQLSTVDADGILRLYTDSVAAYVENARTASATGATQATGDARGRVSLDTVTPCVVESVNARLPYPQVEGEPRVGFCGRTEESESSTSKNKKWQEKRQRPTAESDTGAFFRSDTWEDARQRHAIERGYAYVPQNCTSEREQATSLQPDTDCLRTDGELARICAIGFKHFNLYQRYLPLHQLTRDTGRQGFTYDEYDAILERYGVKGCKAYNRRLLHRGNGFYWNIHGGMIYPVGYVELCKRAIRYAHAHGLHDLYLYGNHPGQRRDMYVSCSGSGADFEGAVLAAWYGAHGSPTISRHTLSILLNRDARSIRRMERRACIRITFNEAQTSDPSAVPLDIHGNIRGDVTHTAGVWSYRLPNTYSTAYAVRQHSRRGQGRKAACWFKHWLSSNRLSGNSEAGNGDIPGQLNRVTRTYCETDKALKSSRKRGNTGVLYVPTLRRNKGAVWTVNAVFSEYI